MSEPEGQWTVDTAMSHMQRQIDNLKSALGERHAAQDKAVETAFLTQHTAMRTAFEAADKAVDKALEAAEKAVKQRADTLDREFHEHLAQVRHENALAFLNADKAVAAALASAKEAVAKAESSVDRRLEGMNEFRKQLADQAATFVSRQEDDAHQAEMNVRILTLAERVALEGQRLNEKVTETERRLTSRLDLMSGQQDGSTAAATRRRGEVSQIVAIMSVVLVGISIAVALILGLNN